MRVGLWRPRRYTLPALALGVVVMLAGCGTVAGQWQMIGPANTQINTLASDPHIPGIIFAGGSDGTTYVARGDHSGVFVASEQSPGHDPVNVLFPNPYASGTVYAGTSGGLYVSRDYGQHYAVRARGLPGGTSVTAITTGGDGSTLYASVAMNGLYTSADGGITWTAVATAVGSSGAAGLPKTGTVQLLYWDTHVKTLYAAVSGTGTGIYASRDDGASWSADDKGMPSHTDAFDLLTLSTGGISVSGPTVYAATSAGVFARAPGAKSWQSMSVGLPAGTVYSLATYAKSPGLLYAGAGNSVYISTDGGKQWRLVAGGLSHAVPAIVVVPGQNTPTVTFVASGQIARYPAAKGSSGGAIGSLLVFLMIGLTAWYILARYGIVPSYKDLRRRFGTRAS
jgi:BNR/Asp-box repeat protein